MATLMTELTKIVANGLADPAHDTWTALDDIYPALVEADKAILGFRPDVNTATKALTTVAGTRQEIGATELRLIDVRCNLSPDETELGSVVRMRTQGVPRNWRTVPAVKEIEGYLFDDRDPRVFECFPPIEAGRKIRVVVSVPFEAYGTIGPETESKLPQTYDAAKVEWALYRCMSKDGSPLAGRADSHLRAFQALLGVKQQRDAQASPKAGHQQT